jgi:hypothetical protein
MSMLSDELTRAYDAHMTADIMAGRRVAGAVLYASNAARIMQRVAGVIIDALRSVADTPAGACDLTLLLMPTIFARTGDT